MHTYDIYEAKQPDIELPRSIYKAMTKTPAIVTPLDEHMGLDIARALGRRGIPVYGLDIISGASAPGRYSKYCQFIPSPNPELNNGNDYIQFLLDFGKKLGRKAVLYPLSDLHVLLISRHRSELKKHFEFEMPDHDTINKLVTKDGLQSVSKQFNIPAPQTIINIKPSKIEKVAREITYPVIIKPTESTYWHTPQFTKFQNPSLIDARAKVFLCQTSAELIDTYHRVVAIDDRIIIQEMIPGEDSRLVYFSFYIDREGKPLGIFAGRKHRVIPTNFGSASYVRSLYDPELFEIGLELLSNTHYRGLGGIEFKKDPRDEKYKLIEFNARFGMWDGLSVRCGVDLPYISYCAALRKPIKPQLSFRNGVIWIDWQRDLRASIAYYRKQQLSLGDWIQSLRGEKMWAIYSRDDWRPGIVFTYILIKKLWNRATHKYH